MDTTRRTLLITGAAAAVVAATRAFAQQPTGDGDTGMPFYEKGDVRIHYQEAGSGFPLLLIPGGGLNSRISLFAESSSFNPIEEFRNEYRCITADLRNANGGLSSGPLEIDRPWDAHTDDHLGDVSAARPHVGHRVPWVYNGAIRGRQNGNPELRVRVRDDRNGKLG